MPEIITKYPDVVITVLKSSGAKCGGEQQPKILTQCPSTQFCSFPGGEMCVYGISQMSTMTQISPSDMSEAIKGVPSLWSPLGITILILLFGIGLLVGMKICNKK